jgi:hypothetical protein
MGSCLAIDSISFPRKRAYRYQETHVPSRDRCIATAIHARIFHCLRTTGLNYVYHMYPEVPATGPTWDRFSWFLSLLRKIRNGSQIRSFYCVIMTQTWGPRHIQAVSRWLPTAAARVRARIWSCGICGGQSGAGAGFLRVLRFPLPIFIPPIAPQSPSSIIWGLYNRPEVAAIPSGHSPTPLRTRWHRPTDLNNQN